MDVWTYRQGGRPFRTIFVGVNLAKFDPIVADPNGRLVNVGLSNRSRAYEFQGDTCTELLGGYVDQFRRSP